MTLTHRHQNRAGKRADAPPVAEANQVRRAVAKTKQALLNRYFGEAGEHSRVLRLALNEAEGLAWQTEFPHLFFPVLAEEKARAAVAWHRRQRVIRLGAEQAFAE